MVVSEMEVTGRTLEGQALRWDTLYRVTDNGRKYYQEGFRRGAFREAIAKRAWFELRPEHWDDRIGTVDFREGADGLIFTAHVEPGDRGDDELELVRSGRRSGVSIRYSPLKSERDAPPWWRTTVDLRELSLTARPQYGPDAKVLAMRSQPVAHDAELAGLLAWTPPEV
jgi:HK97 family phage prohead protease